jgi:hypothetical protein
MNIPADNNPMKVWDGKKWAVIRSALETDRAITELQDKVAEMGALVDRLWELENRP